MTPPLNLLAIETSTEACSVAVWRDGEVFERFGIAPRRHAELTLPWVDAVLAEAGIAKTALDAIAVGVGPGAFTGVRLGVSLAQGMALALGLPAIGISTLAALAMRAAAGDGSRVVAAIDARMGEVYWAPFELRDGEAVALAGEKVSKPEAVSIDGEDWHGAGTGFAAQDGQLATRLAAQLATVDAAALPHAADIARLAVFACQRGQAVPPERLEPAYLRNNVALTLAEQVERRARKG